MEAGGYESECGVHVTVKKFVAITGIVHDLMKGNPAVAAPVMCNSRDGVSGPGVLTLACEARGSLSCLGSINQAHDEVGFNACLGPYSSSGYLEKTNWKP